MKDIFAETIKQVLPILAAAGIAGAIAFGQSLASNAGLCPQTIASPGEVSLLGGVLKGLHSIAKLWATGIA